MTRNSFLYLLFLFTAIATAQAPKNHDTGWIILNDGQKIECYIKYFAASDTKITCRPIEADKKPGEAQTFKSEDIEEIAVYENNTTKQFHKGYMGYMNMGGKMKKHDKQIWLAKVISEDKMEVYHYYQYVDLRNGNTGGFYYFIRMAIKTPEMDFAFDVGYFDGQQSDPFKFQDKEFRDRVKTFAKTHCPALLENIKAKKYNRKEIQGFVKDYIENCGK
ncbi:MAG: hypothetical protein Q8K02_13090 [Flavobacterium sp.]|nr:hypothetical protein [Flavobacterium sp.]